MDDHKEDKEDPDHEMWVVIVVSCATLALVYICCSAIIEFVNWH